MEAMRDAWTDGRLDDLNERAGEIARRMDEGFSRADAKIDRLDTKFDAKIDRLDARFGELETKFDLKSDGLETKFDRLDSRTDVRIENLRTEMRTEFQALHRLILGFGGALVTVVLADTIVGRL